MTYQFKLFDCTPSLPAALKARARSPKNPVWRVADHACRFCFGRVLERVVRGQVIEVCCSECGKQAMGGVEEICSCGADCGALGLALECVKNPHVSAEVPQQIMIREYKVEKD